jgi:hypothetical protein
MTVNAWQEKVLIPTYGVGVPDKNPMFLKSVYTRAAVEWSIPMR